MDKSNVHWTYAYSIGSNGQIKCPVDICLSIGSKGQLKCPLDICMSNGSIGSNGPLDIAWGRCQPMTSFEITYLLHNQKSSGRIPVHWIQWTNQMTTGHLYVHWTQWTTEMSNGHMHVQWIHWTYSLCHLTGLLTALDRCQPMTSFK